MKILTFITSISQNGGGPSRSVPILVRGLAEEGVDITLMFYRTQDMNVHTLEGTAVKVKVLDMTISKKDIEDFIVSEQFDLIQLQSIWDLRYHTIIKIARKHHIPYIITPRGMLEPWSLSQKKWKKRIGLWFYQLKDLKCASCIFTTAEMEAQNVRKLGVHVPISVIPNGIETKDYECRSSYDGIKRQVLFLSRIHEKKGIEVLLYAWNKIKNDYPDWNLLIVGNGDEDYIVSLKQRVAILQLQECVEILPPVFGKEKTSLYQESSLFCLPSYSENFGMVIAEAMACGVPAITSTNTPWQFLNGTGSSNVNGDNRIGWCIELNPDNLEATLRESMAMEPVDLFKMGQKASKLIEEKFHYRSVARKTKQLYQWILKKGAKPDFIYD